jgi:hypothetical protein
MAKEGKELAYNMPIIARARGYRLYDLRGRRYIDLYQNNGRAILGHRPDGMTQIMKSTASRGLIAEYPSVYDGRLEKILKLMYPEYLYFRLYANRERTLEALSKGASARVTGSDITDPAMTDSQKSKAAFWRPFLTDKRMQQDLLVPVLPFPGSFVPDIVCIRNKAAAVKMPPSDMISPFLIDTMVKTVSLLIREMHSPAGVGSEFQRLIDVFTWERRGPYINTQMDQVSYMELFKKALEVGILLPPGENYPIIIPREFSEGEIEGLSRFVRSMSGT